MKCNLCGRTIRTDRPHISAGESIDVNVHVSCLYTAQPLDILRMLELDIVFCYLSGSSSITLKEMSGE